MDEEGTVTDPVACAGWRACSRKLQAAHRRQSTAVV